MCGRFTVLYSWDDPVGSPRASMAL